MKAAHYIFNGSDSRFTAGASYTVREMAIKVNIPIGAMRWRVKGRDNFNDEHLCEVSLKHRQNTAKSCAEKAFDKARRVKIIKACVTSETQYHLKNDPIKLSKIKAWLASVHRHKRQEFWLSIDKLELSEVVDFALDSEVAANA